MALPVDVQSIEVLQTVRAQFARFGEDARNALAATEMEIGRMVDWLTNDRRLYWQAEIKRRKEDLSQIQSELARKRTSQMFGHDANLSEQRDLVRKATVRLREAEEKLEKVRRWVQPLQQAVMEYRSRSRPLADMVDGDLENALALLDRMIVALEQYAGDSSSSTDYVRRFHEERRESTATGEAAEKAKEAEAEAPTHEADPAPDAETRGGA